MTYTIQRYLVELIDVIELGNGRRVTLRPVLPQDEAATQAFVRSLSSTSRNYRFMRGLRELSASLLHGLTSVGYRSHLALLAEVFDDGVEVVVAEARLSSPITKRRVCSRSRDAWRGMGLAATLLRRLQDHAIVARASAVSPVRRSRVMIGSFGLRARLVSRSSQIARSLCCCDSSLRSARGRSRLDW